jgi:hypothetical protein
MIPGQCPSKAHDREHLGLGGRRVLVSRQWSGKTLGQHRADRAAIVRQVLQEAGIDAPTPTGWPPTSSTPTDSPRFVWEDVPVPERDYTTVIAQSLRQAQRWRVQYEQAKTLAAQRGSPPVESNSANPAPVALGAAQLDQEEAWNAC